MAFFMEIENAYGSIKDPMELKQTEQDQWSLLILELEKKRESETPPPNERTVRNTPSK